MFLHNEIKFTNEIESSNSLPFRNVPNGPLGHSVYQKQRILLDIYILKKFHCNK